MRAGTLFLVVSSAPRTVPGMERVSRTIWWMNGLEYGIFTLVFSKSAAAASLLPHLLPWNHLTDFQKCKQNSPACYQVFGINDSLPSFYLGPVALEEAQGLSYKALLISTLILVDFALGGWRGSYHLSCERWDSWQTHLQSDKEAYRLSNLYYLAKQIKSNNFR